jgi:hypothetical protein
MVNLLTKTKPWLTASLLTAATLFAKQDNAKCNPPNLEQGHEASTRQLMNGYSAPARIEVRGTWDVYATGSFLYWQAGQENMEIGIISRNSPEEGKADDTPFQTSYVNHMDVTNPNFTYRPGFKFGIGANLDWDNWDAYAEYTWFHGSIGSGVSPLPATSTGSVVPPNGEYLYPIQGAPGGMASLFFSNAEQSWSLKMDFLDLSLSRSYYSGTRLTVRPFFGVRGAWIRQTLDTEYVGSTSYSNSAPTSSNGWLKAIVNNQSAAWGIGPRTGFESNWLLGYGTRFIGNASGDILYTRYSLHQDQQAAYFSAQDVADPITSNAAVSQTIDYLRAHTDFELGIGWGTYFDNNNWHIDLSATYGFQIFWDQNMFRNFEDSYAQSFAPNGNLYIHGLTMTANFDF